MHQGVALVILFILASFISKSTTEDVSSAENCNRLFNFIEKFFSYTKANVPSVYARWSGSANKAFAINREKDPEGFKAAICKVVDAENLKELSALMPGVGYSSLLKYYRMVQRVVGEEGGYTDLQRNLDSALEFLFTVVNSTKAIPGKGAKRVSDVIDLPTLTHILEVMQVKYGSRWLSAFFMEKNQGILLENPQKLASDLYESATIQEFYEKQKETLGLDPVQAETLRHVFLKGRDDLNQTNKGLKALEFKAEGLQILGEIGLLTLN